MYFSKVMLIGMPGPIVQSFTSLISYPGDMGLIPVRPHTFVENETSDELSKEKVCLALRTGLWSL